MPTPATTLRSTLGTVAGRAAALALVVALSACAGRREVVTADAVLPEVSLVDIQECVDRHGRGHDLSYAPGLSAAEYQQSCRRAADPRKNCEPDRWLSAAAARCVGTFELGGPPPASWSLYLADETAIAAHYGPVWRLAGDGDEIFIDAITGVVLRWPEPVARR
ncbi:MAG: hypothetical protein R3B09_27395 [Nannocystaceae bacterium]